MKFTPHTPEDRQLMLERIGVSDVKELFAGIPDDVRLQHELDLPAPASEPEVLALLRERAKPNQGCGSLVCFAGCGAYDHYSPAIVDAIVSRPEFYTAYTPYQAEVSQGTLQSIYEFQSLVCRLFAMEVANASMYDCGSALAETAHMARQITRRNKVLVAEGVHPWSADVLRTYAQGQNIPVEPVKLEAGTTNLAALKNGLDPDTAAVIVQHPNFFGSVEPMPRIAELCRDAGALLVVAVDPVSLGVLAPPGEYGTDVAVAEGQSCGLPLSFGGPYLGMLATRKKFIRSMPGRLVARTVDVDGRTGHVLALQTREQHIRRERATSNICTNQALMALAATVWLTWYGPTGLARVARHCLSKTRYLAERIAAIPGFEIASARPFFKEFAVQTPIPAGEVVGKGMKHGILAGVDLGRFSPAWKDRLLVAVTEKRTRQELDAYAGFLEQEFES